MSEKRPRNARPLKYPLPTKPTSPVKEASPEYHLKVYDNRSELNLADGSQIVFSEGANDAATKQRYKKITDALTAGFLRDQIRLCREKPDQLLFDGLAESQKKWLDSLADSMTSEVGRAIVGLTVLQLTVKAIEPEQSIRLHKGGSSAKSFGWRDGISMRTLDSAYITPTLRSEGLVKLNADGFMMTRTLAENYPYTRVYKAAIRGARSEWRNIVEGLETQTIQALPALQYFLSKLLNRAALFEKVANETLATLEELVRAGGLGTTAAAIDLLRQHMSASNYAARIMEIAMHALMQSLAEAGALGSATLIPLSQMRSANKKHGNIGDIELSEDDKIIEAWDAKYGKSYLRDELEELHDKLEHHDAVTEAGFVTSETPVLSAELTERIAELQEINDLTIHILTLDEWVTMQYQRALTVISMSEAELAQRWIRAYVESLAQKRRTQAPIDEPSFQWLTAFQSLLLTGINRIK